MARLSKQVPVQILQEYRGPTTPITPKRYRFGLFRVRSPLLAESQLFSLPAGTKMFQFPAFALPIRKYLVFNQVGYPIRKCPDQRLFAPTRSLSQLTTYFIATQSQGIHRSLFLSFSYAKIVVLRLTRNPSFLFTLWTYFFLAREESSSFITKQLNSCFYTLSIRQRSLGNLRITISR